MLLTFRIGAANLGAPLQNFEYANFYNDVHI